MNILQLVSSARVSGAEKHVVVLSERLRRRGHEVTAICPRGEWLPEQFRNAEIPVTQMDMRGAAACSAPFQLARYIRDHRIDLIHSHLTRATYLGLLAGRLGHIPFVSSVHCRTQDLAYRYFFPSRRSRIITVSDFLKAGLLRKGVPESRIRTVYNGTDFCPAAEQESSVDQLPVRAELSLPADAEMIGLFARVEEFKGHFVLAQSVREVVAAHPRAYFVCVGSVEPEVQKALWEITAAAGVAERLRFTGQREDVRRLMSAMDVVTLPSRYEACSMAIIEAMAMGKPVIATRAGGNPELISEGETGMLIERTPEALAHAVNLLLGDTSLRNTMGAASRRRAQALYSADTMVDNIESVYRDVCAA